VSALKTSSAPSPQGATLRPRTLRGRFFGWLAWLGHTVLSVGCIPLSLLLADGWSTRPGDSPYMLIVAVAQAYLWMSAGLLLLPVVAWRRGMPTTTLLMAAIAIVATGLITNTVAAGSTMALLISQAAVFIASLWAWLRMGRWGWLWAILGGLPVCPIVLWSLTRRS
jgi:hypothetical protein